MLLQNDFFFLNPKQRKKKLYSDNCKWLVDNYKYLLRDVNCYKEYIHSILHNFMSENYSTCV